jgi:hypothetical protein
VKVSCWILVVGLALAFAPLAAQENLVQWHRIGASGQFDMSTGEGDMALSATVGQGIAGWTGTEPPIEPAAAAGFWYVIWTTGTHVYVGWNWPSIPIHPMYPEASLVLGPWARNNLFRWNRVLKNIELYPDDFRDMEVGEGYVIWGRDHHEPLYSGYVAYPDYGIPLPARGWSWIGYPRTYDMLEAGLFVRNDVSGDVRSCWDDYHAPDPWVNWNMLFWDPVARTTRILSPFGGGDDDTMHEWLGYRVWTNREDLSLIVPSQ